MTPTAPALDRFRAEARAWLESNLPRRVAGPDLRTEHEVTPEQLIRDRAAQKALYDAGYVGITVPTEYGGRGLSPAHQRVWNEEAAGFALPAPGGIASHVTLAIVLPTILVAGTEAQKRDWVPRMLSGDEIWVQLLSEPGAGSDLAGLLTRAERDGELWTLTGNKIWSSGAMSADFGICLARTDWDAPKHRGLTWFKVPLSDPRVTVRPVREINGSAEFCEEFLDGVTVADDMVIGEVNRGWSIANTMLAIERGAGSSSATAATGSGATAGLAPDLVALARARGLLHDAAVRQLIARAHTNDFMQAALTRRLGKAIASGRADPAAASYIKLGFGRLHPERAAAAMEIGGRAAVAWLDGDDQGSAAAVNFLNGRIMAIAGGSNQIQRNIIGERILGLPREPSFDTDKPFREVRRDARKWGITE